MYKEMCMWCEWELMCVWVLFAFSNLRPQVLEGSSQKRDGSTWRQLKY